MNKVIIIAEAGVNHNGSLETAMKLIDAAAEAGADYVKFQTFKAEKLVSKLAQKAEYQKRNIPADNEDTQFSMLKRLELKQEDHHLLIAHCKKANIKFLSTAFDLDSIDFLSDLGLDFWKIPSGEITNLPYLRKIAVQNKQVVLSTGMATMDEIKKAVEVLISYGLEKNKITVLHCNTEYPTPMSDVNLRAMNQIGSELELSIGYSDHTLGIEVPVAAVALGATIIEKHFTLDKEMEGPDHKASLEPVELIAMVKAIRNIEKALGSGTKMPSASEIKNMAIARKSIHIKNEMTAGDVITESDLVMMRPGDGISPMKMFEVIGKKVVRDLQPSYKLDFQDIE